MKKTVRATLYEKMMDILVYYILDEKNGYNRGYFLGVIHGIETAINLIDAYSYLSDATNEFRMEIFFHA